MKELRRVQVVSGKYLGCKGGVRMEGKGTAYVLMDKTGEVKPFRIEDLVPLNPDGTVKRAAPAVTAASPPPPVQPKKKRAGSDPISAGEIVKYGGKSWEVILRAVFATAKDDRERIVIQCEGETKTLLPTNVQTADGRWGK